MPYNYCKTPLYTHERMSEKYKEFLSLIKIVLTLLTPEMFSITTRVSRHFENCCSNVFLYMSTKTVAEEALDNWVLKVVTAIDTKK